MDKKLLLSILVMTVAIGFASAQQGAIWTTTSTCGAPQDANLYAVGQTVYVHGSNFDNGTYSWDIIGKPGGASTDPGITVASGNEPVNSSGMFCFNAYTIQPGDGGEYGVDFNGKHDNYRVNIINAIPEFGFVAGALTLVSAMGIFFFVRKK